jgi:hypothetical protein
MKHPKWWPILAVVLPVVGVVLITLGLTLFPWPLDEPNSWATVVLLALGLVVILESRFPLKRAFCSWRAHQDEPSEAALLAALNSSKPALQRWALQLLAERAGHPFGEVSCWPISTCSQRQVQNLLALYREWWRLSEEFNAGGTLSDEVARRLRSVVVSAFREELDGQSGVPQPGWLRTPPPLNPEQFVWTLEPEVNATLREVAALINSSPSATVVPRCEELILHRLVELLWGALETGLQLRNHPERNSREFPGRDAEGKEAGVTSAPPGILRDRFEKATDRMADMIRDTLLDWNPEAEDDPEREPPGPLPSLKPGQLLEALRPEVEQVLGEVTRVLNEADAETFEEQVPALRRLFEELLCRAVERGEELQIETAADALPGRGPRGGWVDQFRRMKAAEGRLRHES